MSEAACSRPACRADRRTKRFVGLAALSIPPTLHYLRLARTTVPESRIEIAGRTFILMRSCLTA